MVSRLHHARKQGLKSRVDWTDSQSRRVRSIRGRSARVSKKRVGKGFRELSRLTTDRISRDFVTFNPHFIQSGNHESIQNKRFLSVRRPCIIIFPSRTLLRQFSSDGLDYKTQVHKFVRHYMISNSPLTRGKKRAIESSPPEPSYAVASGSEPPHPTKRGG